MSLISAQHRFLEGPKLMRFERICFKNEPETPARITQKVSCLSKKPFLCIISPATAPDPHAFFSRWTISQAYFGTVPEPRVILLD